MGERSKVWGRVTRLCSNRSALEAEQQRARIPKDVLALLEGNRLKEAEKGEIEEGNYLNE